jgi:hypothetical protein
MLLFISLSRVVSFYGICRKKRADEGTRTAFLISLRVRWKQQTSVHPCTEIAIGMRIYVTTAHHYSPLSRTGCRQTSVPPEASFVVVVAADEEELYFPPPPEGAPMIDLPEVVALPLLDDYSPAEDPQPPPSPQLTSTSVRAPTASVPFSALFIVLSLLPLG